jgi:hypothetical protein
LGSTFDFWWFLARVKRRLDPFLLTTPGTFIIIWAPVVLVYLLNCWKQGAQETPQMA